MKCLNCGHELSDKEINEIAKRMRIIAHNKDIGINNW